MSDPRPHSPVLPGGVSRPFVALLIGIALFGGSALLYAPSLGFGFIGYDEGQVLLGHPNLYNQPSLLASLREILVGYYPREEPLIVRDLSWLFDARLFGFTHAAGYHLGNVLLNAANVVLLFAFLLHATRSRSLASVVAALFALLAVHVEPVCWIMGRKDLLGAFFTLLALLAQSFALRSTSGRNRRVCAVAVFLLLPLAILAKFSAIVLVVLLGLQRLYAPYLDGARAPAEPLALRARGRELLGLWPHLAVTVGLYVWYQHILDAYQVIGWRGPSPLSLAHLRTLAVFVPLSLGVTLGHVFVAGQHAIAYLRPNVGLPLTGMEIAICILTLVGSAATLWFALRRRRDLAFFVLAFFVFMLPYFNIEYIGIWVADRYAYLASSCALAVPVALLLLAWRTGRARLRVTAVAGGVALLGLAGHNLAHGRQHQLAFRDARAFWDHELARAEPSMLAYESYAKTALGEAAAAEPGSAARKEATARLRWAAERGLAYYDSLPWRPRPGYFSRERSHAAGLYTALGLGVGLEGRAVEERLGYHRMAYQMMPSSYTALMLAQALLDLARREPVNEALARESLGYFALYLREAKADPIRRRGLPSLLSQYTDPFPSLAPDVRRVAEENLR
jgi:hypothetical protein